MSISNIKRIMAAALLVAFTAPSTLAISGYESYDSLPPYKSSMTITGDVKLTESNDTITLSLRDSDVKQVLRMFADKAGLNIVFHDSVSGKVTLDLVNTSINEAFGLVLQVSGLNYYQQGNTMIVMSKTSPDNAAYSKQEMMTFPIKYVSADKIANFLNKNVFGMKKAGLSSVDAATVNSATNELIVFGMKSDAAIVQKVIDQFDKEPFTKTFAVNHTTPAEMANMICNLLLPARGVGGSSSTSGAAPAASPFEGMTGGAAEIGSMGGDSSGIKLGEGIIACSVSSTASGSVAPFDMQNLSIAYFPQRGTITLMGGSEAQATMIERFIKANDVKQPQAILEVSIVELTEQGAKEFQNNWAVTSRAWNARFDGGKLSGGRAGGPLEANYIPAVYYSWDSPYGTHHPYLDGSGKVVVPQQVEQPFMYYPSSTVFVSWTMNYLIENRKGRVLANPKIMITNGQESVIDLTEDYIEKVTSEYLTSSVTGTGTTGTAQRNYTISDDLGIKVTLTPFISPEGYVTMNIKPNYSTEAAKVYAPGSGGTELAATLLSRRDLDLKNVRIKDGETLVIGGLIKETEQKTVQKIPFLGDLPLFGPIFRSTSTTKNKNELIIMITPKILNDGEGAIADSL